MEARVRERLVGAVVLVALVVLIVPAILKGRDQEAPPAAQGQATRSVEVPIREDAPEPEEQVLVPEPLADERVASAAAKTAEPAAGAPAPAAPGKPLAPKPGASSPKPAATAPRRESAGDREPAPQTPAVTPPKPAATQAAAASAAWAVQLGAFSNRSKAEQLVAELRKRRYAAFMLEYRASGQVLYRVRVGPEQERAHAEEIAARLAKDGFEPVVARHP